MAVGREFDNFQASGGVFLGQDKGIGCFLAYANYTQGVRERERKFTPWGGRGHDLQPGKVMEMSEVALQGLHAAPLSKGPVSASADFFKRN